ncbi:UNVERIFIED_CONTAM: hypothetical protein Slati_2643600 [Sesamum latifolium]|uniref:Uncharacterized protein n=1 Tax=Sesamum latifolium TaxID=2727402 RepID=A0AAW2VV05_9LAMI
MQTRSQSQSDFQQLHDSISSLLTVVQDIKATIDNRHDHTSAAIAALQQQLSNTNSASPPPLISAPPSPSHVLSDTLPKPPKLQLQLFDGTNALDWVFQADQFFQFYSIPLEQHLKRVGCYMSGDALGGLNRCTPMACFPFDTLSYRRWSKVLGLLFMKTIAKLSSNSARRAQ